MSEYRFLDQEGTFHLDGPENYSGLYFPVAGEGGIKSAVTPNLGGDAKQDQNAFLLEPVSAENLHNNRSTRNFWCTVEGSGSWSVTGASAEAEAVKFTVNQDKSEITAGFMWQTVKRTSKKYQLEAKVTSFVPLGHNVEIMQVEVTNIGKMKCGFIPTAAVPLYGRSADNIRDHRHVTSLLHRIRTTETGVLVKPTLSFDERGHVKNEMTYFVCGVTGENGRPEGFYPVVEDFIGEGGSFTRPRALLDGAAQKAEKAGFSVDGKEAMGGIRFAKAELDPEESISYTILLGMTKNEEEIERIVQAYDSSEKVNRALDEMKEYWKEKVNVSYHSADSNKDNFLHWVSFQPILRRIYGCSFLPHHDYGKGGRGWRDLWQDCLALLIMDPGDVRKMILSNFAGVRVDGTNATIIGEKQGEFVADRNNITRVWMDHGFWPFLTTKFYMDQTGDVAIFKERAAYFKDRQAKRGTALDEAWDTAYGGWQKQSDGTIYEGSILEHLLLEHLCAFYEVGEHNHIRLRGADWNDALDMAGERGESVAFTAAYAGNLKELATYLRLFEKKTGEHDTEIFAEMQQLFAADENLYDSVAAKQKLLENFVQECRHDISGKRIKLSIEEIAENLEKKADWMMRHIRATEWIGDDKENSWFNSYYDNNGRRVEGNTKDGVRMMLTGQVFSIMSKTATEEQVKDITDSADCYLYKEEIGGYRLNTNFHENKTDLGRMFGFAYGEKENGAVFSHMAVMYANALYSRGFAKEGYKVIKALSDAAMNFETSRIYPGIPEYFDAKGRGMYHYLTGAASWYMLNEITQVYGVRGAAGDLMLEPKLLAEQFDEAGNAELALVFRGEKFEITFKNVARREYGEYEIKQVHMDGKLQEHRNAKTAVIPAEAFLGQKQEMHNIEVILG